MLFGHEREPTTSLTADRAIIVAGAFTGGGAQVDLVRTETHINLNESLSWTHGKHLVQAGFQLPDWSRRGFFDRTNFAGSFYFANLVAYVTGRPYAFTRQQGNGDLACSKSRWARTSRTIGRSVRAYPSTTAALRLAELFPRHQQCRPAVRDGLCAGQGKANVLRAGAGVFNDRSGPVVIADVLHSQPGGLTKIVITDPGYPDPFASAAATVPPPSTCNSRPM